MRLSSEPYSTDPRDMANRFIHLTNSSINRHNPNNIQQDSMKRRGELAGGSKCSLHYLQTRMREINVDWPLMWKDIVSVVLKTLYCVQDVIPNNQNAFELFGFDVLIDADLKAWLIEVNSSPSLSRENALDHEIKNKMIADTLRIAAPPAGRSRLSPFSYMHLGLTYRYSRPTTLRTAPTEAVTSHRLVARSEEESCFPPRLRSRMRSSSCFGGSVTTGPETRRTLAFAGRQTTQK